MLRHVLSVVRLAILPAVAAAAPKTMTVYGRAPLSIDPGRIQRWLLWEADPPAAVQFRLGTPMLAPARKK